MHTQGLFKFFSSKNIVNKIFLVWRESIFGVFLKILLHVLVKKYVEKVESDQEKINHRKNTFYCEWHFRSLFFSTLI